MLRDPRLARWCYTHRHATLGLWIAALLGLGALGNVIVKPAYSSRFEIPASQSASGFEVLAERLIPGWLDRILPRIDVEGTRHDEKNGGGDTEEGSAH